MAKDFMADKGKQKMEKKGKKNGPPKMPGGRKQFGK